MLLLMIIIIISGAGTKEGMRHNNRHLNRSDVMWDLGGLI